MCYIMKVHFTNTYIYTGNFVDTKFVNKTPLSAGTGWQPSIHGRLEPAKGVCRSSTSTAVTSITIYPYYPITSLPVSDPYSGGCAIQEKSPCYNSVVAGHFASSCDYYIY